MFILFRMEIKQQQDNNKFGESFPGIKIEHIATKLNNIQLDFKNQFKPTVR